MNPVGFAIGIAMGLIWDNLALGVAIGVALSIIWGED